MKTFNFLFKKAFTLAVILLISTSCSDIDERDFADERYLTDSHFQANSAAGGTTGLEAIDGAILAYFRDGEASTDEFGFEAVENKVHLHDLHATILHLMGLDRERLSYFHQGRDESLTDVGGRVIHDLLA